MMTRPWLMGIVTVAFLSTAHPTLADDASYDDYLVQPGASVGPIEEYTTRAELDGLFGSRRVQDGEVYLAEGFCTDGTVIDPDTPAVLEIGWQDSEHTRIAFIRIPYAQAPWHTALGVRNGITLKQLEKLHGGPLSFSGFGWDYGGGLTWIESDGRIHLQLDMGPDLPDEVQHDPRMGELLGDREVSSDHPLIRLLTIRVVEMTQSWGHVHDERPCE